MEAHQIWLKRDQEFAEFLVSSGIPNRIDAPRQSGTYRDWNVLLVKQSLKLASAPNDNNCIYAFAL
jgi:hypothetical protein